ncbi:hypothetical protein H8D36_07685 [archaeon]|nr:hypothetical protein [archaeon]
MATLEKVMQLQQQGMQDQDIITQLRQEGVSPKEIDNAIAQSKIKAAVSQQPMQEGMEQSITDQTPAPQAQQEGVPEYVPSPPQEGNFEGYAETPQAYSGQEYYSPGAGASTETISEIAEQIVNESFNKYTKKTGDLVIFKNEVKEEISDLNVRLKRIEDSIESLQRDVIRKVGEFGDSNALVHKDLENLHGTVSKLMNPLVDNFKELKKITEGKK